MRIALAQINPTVGDLDANRRRIVDAARRAHQSGADLVVYPECCITGYPPKDLFDSPGFIDAVQQAVRDAAEAAPPDLGILLSAPVPNPGSTGSSLRNAALLYENGVRVATVYKRLLPTYDVFDEHRYFDAAGPQDVVEWRGLRLGIHVCEDMWNLPDASGARRYDADPLGHLADQGADLFINVSASPFSLGKHAERTDVLKRICDAHRRPFVLCNQVGANTELVFDGDSRVHAADGTLVACAASFEEDLILWDTDAPVDAVPAHDAGPDDIADLHDALVLGIRDYYGKTGIFDKALVGLSGGIDSAVTCALAAEALGPDRVYGVTLPARVSSEGSVTDSEALADNLGIAFDRISIRPAVDAFDAMLSDAFAGTEAGVAEENLQSRARGVTLMALSNKFGHLLLATGNKSEMAVGYATLYGDMSGGLAVLSDVLKTRVYDLARYINRHAGRPVIPQNTIDKPPSAELREGQKDTDSLPDYDVLDAVLRRYVEERKELPAIVDETGLDEGLVRDLLDLVDRNEYKRRQAAPGLRVTRKAFGTGRRMPVVARWSRDVLRAAVSSPAAP